MLFEAKIFYSEVIFIQKLFYVSVIRNNSDDNIALAFEEKCCFNSNNSNVLIQKSCNSVTFILFEL
jgi:hypothetical protein